MVRFPIHSFLIAVILLAGPDPAAPAAEPTPGHEDAAKRAEREPFRLRVHRSRHMWFKTSPGRTDAGPLAGGVDAGDPSIERPLWIPAGAYTNSEMIAYYGIGFGKWRKSIKIPEGKTSRTTLGRSIMQYWRGGRPLACVVELKPKTDGPPGSFVFRTLINKEGPRGWLQDTGIKDETGYQYRFWFDQPRSQSPGPESLRGRTTESKTDPEPH